MLQATRWRWAGVVIGGALLCGLAGGAGAQEKKPFEKHDSSALNAALKDVINAGAKLYNDNGDHAGCYRMYQGSLLSVRPFLAPDLQKKIDDSVAKAETMGSFADRAFALRSVLDEIRDRTKPPESKTKLPESTEQQGEVAGKVVFDDKPVAGGYSVTLFGTGDKKFSTRIEKGGSFQFKTPIPVGEYRVAIEPTPKTKGPGLPPRYASAATSGLAIRVQAGKQDVELKLVK
jgi:hypothetical protein